MADLCQHCNHFPVHAPKTQAVQGQYRRCLYWAMNIDCRRWRLWK